MSRSNRSLHGLCAGLYLLVLPFAGCSGDDGAAGAAGVSSAMLSGTVTNDANGGAPIAGATITTSPAVPGVAITTDAAGGYSVELPVGFYTLTCEADHFGELTEDLSVIAGVPRTLDFALTPVSPVVLEVTGVPSAGQPGMSYGLTVTAMPLDGSTVQSYGWSQVGGAAAVIAGPTTATASVTLADAAAYKQELIDHLHVHDRWEVLGVDPHAAELGAEAVLEVAVTTTSGTYTEEVAIHCDLDFLAWSTGLRNVAIDVPVLVGGREQASYDWALTAPGGSVAALQDATTRFPWFVPDIAGDYTLTVTDAVSGPFTLAMRAAAWEGGINGIDGNGRPLTSCASACHSNTFPEKFTDWAYSGHAEIFTNNINTGGHYSSGCFACHTVGFDPGADNGGIDDSNGYAAFMGALFHGGQSHPDPANWQTVVSQYPDQARLTNIQCENCHGPNGGPSHASTPSALRETTSAQLCAFCHGEPPRHGRYQQWAESGHGNFELAIDEGPIGSCAKCHSAQGFLDWFEAGLVNTFSGTGIDANEVQPITCVVCHDPHNVGTTSGNSTNAPLRVEGDTPELYGGYTAYGVGKGAMCIVCHNTRRGDVEAALAATPDRAPHGGAQGDILMGENVFWVTNIRGPHSLITDTCVKCHISLTPPPAELSYNLGGTNHSFEANTSICSECHGAFEAEALMALTDSRLDALAHEIAVALEKEIDFHTAASRVVRVTGEVNGVSTTTDITNASVIEVLHVGSSHGRSAMDIRIDGVDHLHVQCNGDVEIIDGGVGSGNLLDNTYSSIEQVMSRVLWNYNMIGNDSSSGIHNPALVTAMIQATAEQVATNWP